MGRSLPAGIFKVGKGYRAFVRVRRGPGQTELLAKTFPAGTLVTTMKEWREEQRVKARSTLAPTPTKGTFAEDVERYLRQVAAMPTISWRRRDLEAWKRVFGDRRRGSISTAEIRGQLHEWRSVGPQLRFNPRKKTFRTVDAPLSASACNHRRSALLHLWRVLDGKAATNPVREVPPFKEPAPAPRARDLPTIARALETLRTPAMRARALVLLWTGIRGNSELGKMTREHVDLEARLCYVPTGKGGKTFRVVPLTEAGVSAWKDFIAAKAWGEYDKNALRKSIRRACAKAGIEGVRSYDLRHTIATSYLVAGADLADVQLMLGHTTARMTRRYAPFHAGKLRAAGEKLHLAVTASLQGAPSEGDAPK